MISTNPSGFIQPSFELLQELKNQGEVVINSRNNTNNFQQTANPSNGSQQMPQTLAAATSLHRQQSRNGNSPNNGEQLLWDSNRQAIGNSVSSHVTTAKTYASIVKPAAQMISGQCIPGSDTHVSVKLSLSPSKFKEIC
jgi:hypothetical protein